MTVKIIPRHLVKQIRLTHPDLSGTWLDTGDVLRLLHCSPRTLQKLRSYSAFPCYKVNSRLFLYKLEEIQAYIEKFKTPKEERIHHD